MVHLDLLRTIHTPVTAQGSEIRNAFGVGIATAADPLTAQALAELVNLAVPVARKQAQAHNDRETNLGKLFVRRTA